MALADIRVIDLTDERGIYGTKLLADLGAQVLRPESEQGDPLRQRGPFLARDEGGVSLWHSFFASNRTFVSVDQNDVASFQTLQSLCTSADLICVCQDSPSAALVDLEAAKEANPGLVVVELSSFGKEGPWSDFLAPDIVAGALGGAAATTGDVDTAPLKNFGELNFMISGAYAAIAALSALYSQRRTGQGQTAHLSVHECIASCLEHVFMFYFYHQTLNRPEGRVLPRRGALHWSDAYGVMQGLNGCIMATPAPDFDNQLMWLIEEDVHDDLIDPKYMEPENLRLRTHRVMEIMGGWIANKDVEALFHEAQSRHAPYGWVLPIEKVAENPQLRERNWYVPYEIDQATISSPGAPYHFSKTPWQLKPYRSEAKPVGEIAGQLGWHPRENPSAAADQTKPLAGLKVLDFTHVLAGPFATRMLADMGADVIKINSAERAVTTQDPHHPYYLMWNRNKRALALKMSDPSAKQLARRLADEADIVIDNFSVGVLDRWGIGYDDVSQTNAGVIYVQMSGMGDGGPWSKYVTYAPTIHALCGLTATTGVPGREDIGIGFSYNDHQAGLHGAVAVLAALQARHQTGKGQRVDISQFEVGINFIGPSLLDYAANGTKARPTGNHLPYDAMAPHGCYRCADAPKDTGADVDTQAMVAQRWIAIACTSDAQWLALKTVMGLPGWAEDEAFATSEGRYQQRTTLDERIAQWTKTQDAHELMMQCQAAGVPAGVVQDGADLAEHDPQLRLRGFLQPLDDVHPTLGPTWIDRLVIQFDATPCDDYQRVRAVGEDSGAILKDWLNLDDDSLNELTDAGVLS
jgi:crotonobetainyl-CoA:carnitine CoA-transferase CaiB-like acyl-CoA transferase